MSKREYCTGCREDFYNTEGSHLAIGGQCMSLKTAKVVTKFRIGWWTAPTEPGAFTEVKTHSCHSAPGRYAHYDRLPVFAVSPKRMGRPE